MPQTNHGSIEFLKFPNPLYPGDDTRMIKKWLRDSWARRKILALQQAIAGITVPTASTANPQMDGTASPGTSTAWARGDHIHPHDTSKQDSLSTAQLAAVNSGITADDIAVDDASVLCTVTPTVPTLQNGAAHYASYGGCYYYKIGHRVSVHIGVSGLTAATKTRLFTLPAGYRPKAHIGATGVAQDIMYYSRIQVTSDGYVYIYSEGRYAYVDVTFDAFQ